MIWIVLGCCWVSQIRTKPTKNIWGPLLDSISSYYVQCPWKIVSFFQVFRHLNYHILVFFPAYIGLYWTPAGWYGQKPYLGPAHMWLRQNMAVCDAELGPKWGGVTNTRFTFLASYFSLFLFLHEHPRMSQLSRPWPFVISILLIIAILTDKNDQCGGKPPRVHYSFSCRIE